MRPDRAAHQQQLAASIAHLTVAPTLPPALDGLGLFERGTSHVGLGRVSTGLGCPHAETEADFLGLMVAFRTTAGRRVDFVTIHDPASPTDTPEEFMALLQATADAAGGATMFASQARLLLSLGRHAGLRAPAIALQVTAQTFRTVRSTTAYQQYWTGIVRARDELGKFTFLPTTPPPDGHERSRGPTHLSDDWRRRQQAGPLAFEVWWLPFVSDTRTPLDNLTAPWDDRRKVNVGELVFPAVDPAAPEARLVALLASEMGANPGNWVETTDGATPDLPATRFTASRLLAYRESQRSRGALADEAYASFFARGEIDDALARELIRRYREKRAIGHAVPDVGDLPAPAV
jgi:hypothetical protein